MLGFLERFSRTLSFTRSRPDPRQKLIGLEAAHAFYVSAFYEFTTFALTSERRPSSAEPISVGNIFIVQV